MKQDKKVVLITQEHQHPANFTTKFIEYPDDRISIEFSIEGRTVCNLMHYIPGGRLNRKGDTSVNWSAWGAQDAQTVLLFTAALSYAGTIANNLEQGKEDPYITRARRDGEYLYEDEE